MRHLPPDPSPAAPFAAALVRSARGMRRAAVVRALALAPLAGAAAPAFAQTPAAAAGAPVALAGAPLAPAGETRADLGFRFDCVHNFNVDRGATQDCLGISGARMTLRHRASETVRAMLRIDPFATPHSAREDLPLRDDLPKAADSALGIIDAFAVDWTARPNLQVSVQTYEGAARIPSVSGLAFANSLADTGWRTTAMTIGYALTVPTPMHVQFAAGNGEGEPARNAAPEQYFGFEADVVVVRGVHAVVGGSLSGNDIGSEEYQYAMKRYAADCQTAPKVYTNRLGHSTQRLAAGVLLDGTVAGAEGLRVGLGVQRNIATDLDKKGGAYPTTDELDKCGRPLDLDAVYIENPSGETANSVKRTTMGASLNYRIHDGYFLAADYSTRRIDTGQVQLFQDCTGYTGSVCSSPSPYRRNRLSQDAFTVGGGLELATGLQLTLEYYKAAFDRAYAEAYYLSPGGKASTALEVFNARLAYNWK